RSSAENMMNPDGGKAGGTALGAGGDPFDALSRIDSRQLRAFLAVVRNKSFTNAAEALNVTQPALSRSVQLLEERLGVRLIERTPKSFQLTRFGHAVFDRAMAIERHSTQIFSEINALQTGAEGRISLGVGPSSIGVLAPAITAFQNARPSLQLRVLLNSMEKNYQALLDGDLDVICTALNFPDHRRLVTEEFVKVENIVLASAEHDLAGPAAVKVSDLATYPWIFFSDDTMGYQRVAGFFAANNVPPPVAAIECNALDAIFKLLKSGPYLASVPAVVLPDARRAGLDRLETEGAFWSVAIGIAYLRTANPPPAITALGLALRRHFEAAVEADL
ncbi:MAG: LysR family transcriptional regulator, partial [Pararhodobacter sp.]|nr:LysR family transcriptional regulator [Pararhodobacter sp.]